MLWRNFGSGAHSSVTGDPSQEDQRDKEETENLSARFQNFEEHVQGMHQPMGEMMGSNETSMGEGSASRKREGEEEDRQKWIGAWWIQVEQQNLNSR